MKKLFIAVTVSVLLLMGTGQAQAISLLMNGDFETGDFTGWTVNSIVNGDYPGDFYIDDNDGWTPVSGYNTVGPAGGSYYAISDQTGPLLAALSQTFTVPDSTTNVILSFDMFVNNQTETVIALDGFANFPNTSNQHARVDLLSSGADPFATDSAVLQNFYLGSDAGENPHDYTHYSFDITSLVTPGESYDLRFAQVDTNWYFQMGVDNVDISTASGVIPEPMSMLLFASGLVGFAGLRRKR